MVKTMTQDTKDRIADLERQKIVLEDRLEYVGNNLVKMHQIEQEIFEIEDTIRSDSADTISSLKSSGYCLQSKTVFILDRILG